MLKVLEIAKNCVYGFAIFVLGVGIVSSCVDNSSSPSSSSSSLSSSSSALSSNSSSSSSSSQYERCLESVKQEIQGTNLEIIDSESELYRVAIKTYRCKQYIQ